MGGGVRRGGQVHARAVRPEQDSVLVRAAGHGKFDRGDHDHRRDAAGLRRQGRGGDEKDEGVREEIRRSVAVQREEPQQRAGVPPVHVRRVLPREAVLQLRLDVLVRGQGDGPGAGGDQDQRVRPLRRGRGRLRRRRLQVLQGERRGGATQAGGLPGNRPRCHVQRGRQLRDQAVRLRLQRPLLLVRGRPDRGGGGRHQDRVRRPGHEPELRRRR